MARRLPDGLYFLDDSSIDEDKGYKEITGSYTNAKVRTLDERQKKLIKDYMNEQYPPPKCCECVLM